MMKIIISVLFVLMVLSCNKGSSVKVEWTDDLQGDFSFTEKWSYDEGIYRNEYGQLVCDGLCDGNSYRMLDENGRIYPDSLRRYYQLIDTTHYYHTVESEAQCYEWIGTDFAYAYRGKDDTIKCYTACNMGTHSSLELKIIDDKCFSRIALNGVKTGIEYFSNQSGYIRIDKPLLEKNILKAEFHFDFIHSDNTEKPIWWKGKIQTKISNK